jgi:membrane associated rhomboid family serine protease
MSTAETAMRVLLVAALLGAFGYAWYIEGRGRWRAVLTKRFVYGVPWGTVLSVLGVLAFYLFAQSGLTHWNDPVTVAFRSWSYSYLPGMLAAGFAHASPGHLVGNLVGTVVLASVAEFAWGHYPPDAAGGGRDPADEYQYPPPAEPAGSTAGRTAAVADDGDDRGLLERPWFRAFVAFPAAVFVVSVLTSVFALGWSLGFSGTVFAFGGFVVVVMPLTAVVSMLAISAVGVSYRALTEPVMRATTDSGAPGPPSWAGVNVQAHLLGFLFGVVLGLALLRARDRRPAVGRVFLAAFVFGVARQLWALPWSADDTYFLYRAVGLVFVLVLTTLITATAAAGDEPLVDSDSRLTTLGRVVAALWLGVVVVAVAATGLATRSPAVLVPALGVAAMLAYPALLPVAPLLPGDAGGLRTTRRATLVAGLVLVTGLLAAFSTPGNLPGMDEDPVPEGAVAVKDYRVTYAEDALSGKINSTDSGVIVVSDRRDIWIATVDDDVLAHEGEAVVPLGGVGWRRPVTARRSGWEVVGNDSVYAVDLEVGGETTRSFMSSPSRAAARISNHTVTLTAGADAFRVSVARNGTAVGEAAIPDRNESVTVGPIQFLVEPDGGTLSLVATNDGTRIEVARREEY